MTARTLWKGRGSRERAHALACHVLDHSSEPESKELASLILAEIHGPDNGAAAIDSAFRLLSPEERGALLDHLAAIHRHTSPGSTARESDR